MKISLNWLRELIDVPVGPDELGARLAELGYPLERLTKTGVDVENVIAAKLLAVEKHPNADRLSVTKVFDGQGERIVVCGAKNIAAGQVVPLALPGAKFA